MQSFSLCLEVSIVCKSPTYQMYCGTAVEDEDCEYRWSLSFCWAKVAKCDAYLDRPWGIMLFDLLSLFR